jgi:hypothetical protein
MLPMSRSLTTSTGGRSLSDTDAAGLAISRTRRFLLLLLVVFLTGMGQLPATTAVTLVPVAGERQEIDPRLLGRWRTASDGTLSPASVEVRRSSTFADRYEVEIPWYFARPVEGRLVQLSDDDETWTVLECSVSVRAIDSGLLLPARHHFGIRLDGDRLVVSLLSLQLGYMAMAGGGPRGALWVRDLETTNAGLVAVIVADSGDVRNQLAIAAKRIAPQWVLTFERER